ncbi:flagellar hook-associated protein FlgK [Agrobacterium vitis]|uniref:Flagellar hook-associated protein 1 n=1 Tax=Agrobacterium vitis TaxID=373 RepID=A0A125P3N0_AGRVI|nr:flagellar hook-associated protein FlgK [Agrobacterium vitis]KAA3506330.1 flagellar hook-associated protein FlgK [Agrobacterium vitis]KAA3520729.1 flagellar hook-associated protein FlgK [Agrobacterium vitis]MCE6075003.1 flagellar hook-associated protein FlgK [Agrobacterium vitis]MCF1451665.1 flagellar hook-associated protein FlgK [Agrobacterium vitis]MCF1469116.1 flagellar hook-associated protein FlgK [Agrobacterium vitis]
MSLSSTMNTATTSLGNTGVQSQVLSKNIANSQTEGYVKRDAATISTSTGGAQVVTTRNEDAVLQKQMLSGQSQAEGQDTLNTGLDQLKALLGGNDYESSPSTYINKLRDAMQSYAAQPSELSLAETAVSAAQDVATSINNTAEGISNVRAQADDAIKDDVNKLNDLLSQFETVNQSVVKATATGNDPNDALDQRDKLVSDISKIVGVSSVKRDNNDMALYTNDGTVLFDKQPRTVTFDSTGAYGASTEGNSVYIDGVPVKAGTGGNTTAEGSIAANLQIRDSIAPQMQQQLDETSRSLIKMFSETEPSTKDNDMPGLFTWEDGTTPEDGTLVSGISESFKVNSAYVTAEDGDPTLLRDGGANGSNYTWNTTEGVSYSELLDDLVTGFEDERDFDSSAGLGDTSNVLDYASNSVGWLESYRSTADSANETKSALSQRATEAYQNKTGVNLDEELSKMLDIEQSYKASTKLMNAVDEMLKSLLEIA